jgi:hypothetical protein
MALLNLGRETRWEIGIGAEARRMGAHSQAGDRGGFPRPAGLRQAGSW